MLVVLSRVNASRLRVGRALLVCVGLLLAGRAASAADAGYPRADLLVEPAALQQEISASTPALVILDARPQTDFEARRIPGARWVDAAAWAKLFDSDQDAAAWSKRIGDLGIRATSSVVVYDAVSTKDAARIWWILRYWSVGRVRLLNGGWIGWTQAALPTASNPPPAVAPATFVAVAQAERLATKAQLLAALPRKDLQIVDARSEREHCGLELLKNKRGGTIPGAKHLDWVDLLDRTTQRFKSPAELKSLFADAGIDVQRPTATHCQSGGRAAVMAFALELMGAPRVRNYYASWQEWGNAGDTPIESGKSRSAAAQ